MKILVMPKPIEGVSREEMLQHAPAEIQAVWELYKQGIVREFYTRANEPNRVVLVFESASVEAGKEAAGKLLQLQKRVQAELSGEGKTAEQIARSIDADPEDVFHLLRHLASNAPRIKVVPGEEAVDDRFSLGQSP